MPHPVITVINRANVNSWADNVRSLHKLARIPRTRPMLALYLRRELNRYSNLYQEGDAFLSDLSVNPLNSIMQLDMHLTKMIVEFDRQYPAERSLLVRQALFQLGSSGANIVLHAHSNNSLHSHRCSYLQYCGLLAVVYKQLEESNDKLAKVLLKKITTVLEQTHIKFDGDLPDQWALRENASGYFIRNNPLLTLHELVTLENENYRAATTNFEAVLAMLPEHIRNNEIKILARTVYADICMQQGNVYFDKPFFSKLLHSMTEFLKKPADQQAQQDFLHHMNHVKGRPSIYKKAAGLFLMVLASTITAAGTALSIMLGAEFSAFVVLGVAMVYEGARIFKSGCRHGTSLSMMSLFKLRESIVVATPIVPEANANISAAPPFRAFSGVGFKLGTY